MILSRPVGSIERLIQRLNTLGRCSDSNKMCLSVSSRCCPAVPAGPPALPPLSPPPFPCGVSILQVRKTNTPSVLQWLSCARMSCVAVTREICVGELILTVRQSCTLLKTPQVATMSWLCCGLNLAASSNPARSGHEE